MIPPFDVLGLLPRGLHDATLTDIQDTFCWNAHRQQLFDGLGAFLNQAWPAYNIRCPIWIDGSFVRLHDFPQDIDVVFDLYELSLIDALVIAVDFQNNRAAYKARFGVDVWTRHPQFGANDLGDFFQYVGIKAAAQLRVQPTHAKGIIRTWSS